MVIVPAPGISLQDGEAALDGAIAQFMETGVDPEQLERIKQQLRAEQIYARDDASSVANRYGRALAVGLSVQDVMDWPVLLEAVSAEDIMAVAQEVLVKQSSVTGWLMKKEASE